MSHAETCKFGVNDSGTCEESDTPLTQVGSRDVPGHTYFVRRRNGDIKIGFSANPVHRIKTLAREFPGLMVLAVVPIAFIGELAAHQKFDHLRLEGEWFQSAPDLLDFIQQAKDQNPPSEMVKLDAFSRHLSVINPTLNAKARQVASNIRQTIASLVDAEGEHQRKALMKYLSGELVRFEAARQ